MCPPFFAKLKNFHNLTASVNLTKHFNFYSNNFKSAKV